MLHACCSPSNLDSEATIISIDGVGVGPHLQNCNVASLDAHGRQRQVFFVASMTVFHEGGGKVTYVIHQGEGGELGDPLTCMFFALGHHRSLVKPKHG